MKRREPTAQHSSITPDGLVSLSGSSPNFRFNYTRGCEIVAERPYFSTESRIKRNHVRYQAKSLHCYLRKRLRETLGHLFGPAYSLNQRFCGKLRSPYPQLRGGPSRMSIEFVHDACHAFVTVSTLLYEGKDIAV